MNIRPSLEEVRAVAETGTCKVLPVSCELLSDLCTPIHALKKLKNVSTHCYGRNGAATPSWDMIPSWKSPVWTEK